MNSKRRMIAGILAAVLLVFTLSVPMLSAVHNHTHHHEAGVECSICRQIEVLTQKGKELTTILAVAVLAVASVFFAVEGTVFQNPAVVIPTLVRLKVKLSD